MPTNVPKIPDDYLKEKYEELEYRLKIQLDYEDAIRKLKKLMKDKELGRAKETKHDTVSEV